MDWGRGTQAKIRNTGWNTRNDSDTRKIPQIFFHILILHAIHLLILSAV